MNSLIHVDKGYYREAVESLARISNRNFQNTCFISFNSPYYVVVDFLDRLHDLEAERFVVIDASKKEYQRTAVDHRTYTMPVADLFKVYLFLREIITDKQVESVLVDSVSALIYKFSDFPLKRMLSDLLLEMGARGCDTSLMVFNEHKDHEITNSLRPLVQKNISL